MTRLACRHYGRPRSCCPVYLAADALVLLKSGRSAMAERLLEELPDLIRDQLGSVYALAHNRVVLAQRDRKSAFVRARDRGPKVAKSGEVPA